MNGNEWDAVSTAEPPATEDQWNEVSAPEGKDFFGLKDTASGIWDAISGLKDTAPASFHRLEQGLRRPDQYSPEARKAFDDERQYVEDLQTKTLQNRLAGTSTSTGETFREVGPSLGFSLTALGSALATRGAGTLLGVPRGGWWGAALGFLTSGGGAGAASYRMAGSQFLDDAFHALEGDSMQKKGRPMTEDEKTAAYDALLPVAENTALWEAGPEAISNAVMLGLGKTAIAGLGKDQLQNIANTALKRAGIRMLAGGGTALSELGSETATELGQAPDRAKLEAFRRGEDMSTAKSPYDQPGGTLEAFKQIAPVTLAQTALLGAGAKGVQLATKPFYERLTQATDQAAQSAQQAGLPQTAQALQQAAQVAAQQGSVFAPREPLTAPVTPVPTATPENQAAQQARATEPLVHTGETQDTFFRQGQWVDEAGNVAPNAQELEAERQKYIQTGELPEGMQPVAEPVVGPTTTPSVAPPAPDSPTSHPIQSPLARINERTDRNLSIRDSEGNIDRKATQENRNKMAQEAGLSWEEWEEQRRREHAEDSLEDGDIIEFVTTDAAGDHTVRLRVEVDTLTGKKTVRNITEGSPTEGFVQPITANLSTTMAGAKNLTVDKKGEKARKERKERKAAQKAEAPTLQAPTRQQVESDILSRVDEKTARSMRLPEILAMPEVNAPIPGVLAARLNDSVGLGMASRYELIFDSRENAEKFMADVEQRRLPHGINEVGPMAIVNVRGDKSLSEIDAAYGTSVVQEAAPVATAPEVAAPVSPKSQAKTAGINVPQNPKADLEREATSIYQNKAENQYEYTNASEAWEKAIEGVDAQLLQQTPTSGTVTDTITGDLASILKVLEGRTSPSDLWFGSAKAEKPGNEAGLLGGYGYQTKTYGSFILIGKPNDSRLNSVSAVYVAPHAERLIPSLQKAFPDTKFVTKETIGEHISSQANEALSPEKTKPLAIRGGKGIPVEMGKPGYRVTDEDKNDEYNKLGGWKLHLAVSPENYKEVDEWLSRTHKGQYKLLQGGDVAESDFTIYVGERDAADSLASKIESEIGNLLMDKTDENLASDAKFNSKVSGRFDVQRTGNLRDVPWTYYGSEGIPYDEQAKQAGFGSKTRDEYHEATKVDKGRIHSELIKKYGTRYTGTKPSKTDAVQEPRPEVVLPREQGETTETGSEPERVGPVEQGAEPSVQGQPEAKETEVKPPQASRQRPRTIATGVRESDVKSAVTGLKKLLPNLARAWIGTRAQLNEHLRNSDEVRPDWRIRWMSRPENVDKTPEDSEKAFIQWIENGLNGQEGFTFNGKTFLITDQISVYKNESPAQAARRVLIHEDAHEGLNYLREVSPDVEAQWQKLRSEIPEQELDDLTHLYPELSNWRQSEELHDIIAHEWMAAKIAEIERRGQPKPESLLGRILQWFKDAWKKLFGSEVDPTDQQLLSFIDATREARFRAQEEAARRGVNYSAADPTGGADMTPNRYFHLADRPVTDTPAPDYNLMSERRRQAYESLNDNPNVPDDLKYLTQFLGNPTSNKRLRQEFPVMVEYARNRLGGIHGQIPAVTPENTERAIKEARAMLSRKTYARSLKEEFQSLVSPRDDETGQPLHSGDAVAAVMQLELMDYATRMMKGGDSSLLELLEPFANDVILGDYITMSGAARLLQARSMVSKDNGYFTALQLNNGAMHEKAEESAGGKEKLKEAVEAAWSDEVKDEFEEAAVPIVAEVEEKAKEDIPKYEEERWFEIVLAHLEGEERALAIQFEHAWQEYSMLLQIQDEIESRAASSTQASSAADYAERFKQYAANPAELKKALEAAKSTAMELLRKMTVQPTSAETKEARKTRTKTMPKAHAALSADAQAKKLLKAYEERNKRVKREKPAWRKAFEEQVRNPKPAAEFFKIMQDSGVSLDMAAKMEETASQIRSEREKKDAQKELERYRESIEKSEGRESKMMEKLAEQREKARIAAENKSQADAERAAELERRELERKTEEAKADLERYYAGIEREEAKEKALIDKLASQREREKAASENRTKARELREAESRQREEQRKAQQAQDDLKRYYEGIEREEAKERALIEKVATQQAKAKAAAENRVIAAAKKETESERKAAEKRDKERKAELERYYAEIEREEGREAAMQAKLAEKRAKEQAKLSNKATAAAQKLAEREAEEEFLERTKHEREADKIIKQLRSDPKDGARTLSKMRELLKQFRNGTITRDQFVQGAILLRVPQQKINQLADLTIQEMQRRVDKTADTIAAKVLEDARPAQPKTGKRINPKSFLGSVVKAILNTPLQQQKILRGSDVDSNPVTEDGYSNPWNPAWVEQTFTKALMDQGLPEDRAREMAKGLTGKMDSIMRKAQEKAVEKAGKRMGMKEPKIKDMQAAIRAGALPGASSNVNPVVQGLANAAGYSPLTPQDFQRLAELDEQMNLGSLTLTAKATTEMIKILEKVSPNKPFLRLLEQIFVYGALSSLSVFNLNWTHPPYILARKFVTDLLGVIYDTAGGKGKAGRAENLKLLGETFTSLMESRRNFYAQAKFSIKNDAYQNRQQELLNAEHRIYKELMQALEEAKNLKNPAKALWGMVKLPWLSSDWVRRILATADQTWASAIQNYVMRNESMRELVNRVGMSVEQAAFLVNKAKDQGDAEVLRQTAMGQDDETARLVGQDAFRKLLADEVSRQVHAVEPSSKDAGGAILATAEREPLMELGNRRSEDSPWWDIPNKLLEGVKHATSTFRNKVPLFGRPITGFISVGANLLNRSFYLTPLGFLRVAAKLKSAQRDAFYKETMGTDAQVRMRLHEAISATVAMLVIAALRAVDDDEDEGMSITGMGPENRGVREAWLKEGHKPGHIEFMKDGKIIASLPYTRGGLDHMAVALTSFGAMDDLRLDGHTQDEDGMRYGWEYLQTWGSNQARQAQFFALKAVVGAAPKSDKPEAFAGWLGYAANPFTPWGGLTKSTTKMFSGQQDEGSMRAAILSNIPVLQPVFGVPEPKRNYLGDQVGGSPREGWKHVLERMSHAGFPISLGLNPQPEDEDIYSFILRNGIAPSMPLRSELESKNGWIPDASWANYLEVRGQILKAELRKNMPRLQAMSEEDKERAMSSISSDATHAAKKRLRLK